MNDDTLINVELLLGSRRFVTVQRLEPDGSLLMGGYSISYDRYGVEIGRSEITWNGRPTDFAQCLPEMAKKMTIGVNHE